MRRGGTAGASSSAGGRSARPIEPVRWSLPRERSGFAEPALPAAGSPYGQPAWL